MQKLSGTERLDRRQMLRSAAVTTVALATGALSTRNALAQGEVAQAYKVAVVSAPSVEFDLAASVSKAIALIGEAASAGAKLIAFGETWLPGYPKAHNFEPDWIAKNLRHYAANSLVFGSPLWNSLLQAARDHQIHVCLGYSEKADQYLFMGQALIGPDGKPLIVRRKIRASGAERKFWSDSDMDQLKVVRTNLGRVGALECWEHMHPQMTYNMLAQNEDLHIAAWPYMPAAHQKSQYWENKDVNLAAARYYALLSSSYALVPAVGDVVVFGPDGLTVAESNASQPGKSLLYATIDPKNFAKRASTDPRGEFSWGVLDMISKNYPGDKTADPEHGNKNMVPLP
jgi:aliphatic nitrilase